MCVQGFCPPLCPATSTTGCFLYVNSPTAGSPFQGTLSLRQIVSFFTFKIAYRTFPYYHLLYYKTGLNNMSS